MERIQIALDESEASRRALEYLARIVGGREDISLFVCHILPPIPPRLISLDEAERAVREDRLDREVEAARARWLEKAEQAARPLLEEARRVLEEAGVPAARIRTFSLPPSGGSDLAETILATAADNECGTLVVGRESFSKFREILTGHVSDEVVRKARGRTVWVVEPTGGGTGLP